MFHKSIGLILAAFVLSGCGAPDEQSPGEQAFQAGYEQLVEAERNPGRPVAIPSDWFNQFADGQWSFRGDGLDGRLIGTGSARVMVREKAGDHEVWIGCLPHAEKHLAGDYGRSAQATSGYVPLQSIALMADCDTWNGASP